MRIYVLKCEHDTFYIGKTSRSVKKRFEEHSSSGFSGSAYRGSAVLGSASAGSSLGFLGSAVSGSAWTKLHKPIEIIEEFEQKSVFDEDNKTKEYMMRYGIDNVRGGTYSSLKLSKEELLFLKKEFKSLKDECYNCGSNSHFIKDCPNDPNNGNNDPNNGNNLLKEKVNAVNRKNPYNTSLFPFILFIFSFLLVRYVKCYLLNFSI